MKKRISSSLVYVFLAIALFTIPSGCSLLHPGKQHKVEKKQAQERKKADKEYEKARKQHLDLQNKETKQMMKKTKKRSTVVNKPKKRGFFSSKKCN
jgi:hypothetical protein